MIKLQLHLPPAGVIILATLIVLGFWQEGYFTLFHGIPLVLIAVSTCMTFRNKWILLSVTAAAGILVIFINAVNWTWPLMHSPDARGYWELSRNAVQDIGLNLFRPKGYPWFLSLFETPGTASKAQIVLRLLLTALLGLIGWQQKWRPGLIMIICFLFGVNVLWIQEQYQILDTTLFSILFFLAFYAFNRVYNRFSKGWLLIYACSAGLCTLTRQIADPFLFLGLTVLFLKYRKRFITFSITALIIFLIGWSGLFVNQLKYGIPTRSIALGINLYTHSSYFELADKRSPEWHKLKPVLELYPPPPGYWDYHYHNDQSWYAAAVPHRFQSYLESQGMSRVETDNYLKNLFVAWVKQYPGKYIRSVINEFFRLMFKCEEYAILSLSQKIFPKSLWLTRQERAFIYWPIWLLLLLPAPLLFNRNSWKPPFIAAYAIPWLYFIMVSLVAIGITRYVLPMLPFLYFCLGESFNKYWAGLICSGNSATKT